MLIEYGVNEAAHRTTAHALSSLSVKLQLLNIFANKTTDFSAFDFSIIQNKNKTVSVTFTRLFIKYS